MESRSLVPQSSSFQLPIAQVRSVFRPDEVERKLAKLQDMGGQRALLELQLPPFHVEIAHALLRGFQFGKQLA